MDSKKTEIIERLENLNTFGFTLDGNILVKQEDWFWLQEMVEQQQQEIENYKFALSKIMNTHSFISQGKMQYTATGEIAKKALDKNLVNTR